MAKFCTKCGKKLKEGEVCSCEEKTSKKIEKEVDTKEEVSNLVNEIKDIFKKFFKKPVKTMKENKKEKNFNVSAILLVITAALAGLFTYCMLQSVVNTIGTIFGSLISRTGLGTFGSNDIPFLNVFFKVLIYVLVYYVVFILMTFIMLKEVYKEEKRIKELVVYLGQTKPVMIVSLILAVIFAYVQLGVAFAILVAGLIFNLIYLVQSMEDSLDINKEKVAYVLVSSIAVALFVTLYVLPKLF